LGIGKPWPDSPCSVSVWLGGDINATNERTGSFKDVNMKSNWSNSAGWGLIAAAVLVLAVLRRLDLLLIVAPLSVLFSYHLARARARSRSTQPLNQAGLEYRLQHETSSQ
jgi:uncharacterized membrane protein